MDLSSIVKREMGAYFIQKEIEKHLNKNLDTIRIRKNLEYKGIIIKYLDYRQENKSKFKSDVYINDTEYDTMYDAIALIDKQYRLFHSKYENSDNNLDCTTLAKYRISNGEAIIDTASVISLSREIKEYYIRSTKFELEWVVLGSLYYMVRNKVGQDDKNNSLYKELFDIYAECFDIFKPPKKKNL
jgi:hypothetical protein